MYVMYDSYSGKSYLATDSIDIYPLNVNSKSDAPLSIPPLAIPQIVHNSFFLRLSEFASLLKLASIKYTYNSIMYHAKKSTINSIIIPQIPAKFYTVKPPKIHATYVTTSLPVAKAIANFLSTYPTTSLMPFRTALQLLSYPDHYPYSRYVFFLKQFYECLQIPQNDFIRNFFENPYEIKKIPPFKPQYPYLPVKKKNIKPLQLITSIIHVYCGVFVYIPDSLIQYVLMYIKSL